MQRHHVGTVTQGVVGVGMHLDEQTIYPYSHRRPGQRCHEFPLPARAGASPAAGLIQSLSKGLAEGVAEPSRAMP